LDAAVRNRHTVAQRGRAELLAIEEAIEDAGARDLARVLEDEAHLLEEPRLAAHVEPERHVLERQEARDEVHGRVDARGYRGRRGLQAWGRRLIACAWRFTWKRSLWRITCRSSLSISWSIAAYMSPSLQRTWMSLPER